MVKKLTPLKNPDRRSSDNTVSIGQLVFSAGAILDTLWNDLSLTDRRRLHSAAVRALNKHLKDLTE